MHSIHFIFLMTGTNSSNTVCTFEEDILSSTFFSNNQNPLIIISWSESIILF
jgi:hypothetical protein